MKPEVAPLALDSVTYQLVQSGEVSDVPPELRSEVAKCGKQVFEAMGKLHEELPMITWDQWQEVSSEKMAFPAVGSKLEWENWAEFAFDRLKARAKEARTQGADPLFPETGARERDEYDEDDDEEAESAAARTTEERAACENTGDVEASFFHSIGRGSSTTTTTSDLCLADLALLPEDESAPQMDGCLPSGDQEAAFFMRRILLEVHSNKLDAFEVAQAKFLKAEKKLQEARLDQRREVLRGGPKQVATIIGCTVNGAAIHRDLLMRAEPSVLIVEEAAEIPEPALMACLFPTLKRIVMIGGMLFLFPHFILQSNRLITSSTPSPPQTTNS